MLLRQTVKLLRTRAFVLSSLTCASQINLMQPILSRTKYTSPSKFKEMKGKSDKTSHVDHEVEAITDELELDDREYDMLASNAMHVTKKLLNEHNVFVIQPYVKWGPKKLTTKPEHQLKEAEALVRSLPKWTVEHSLTVPLEGMDKKHIFGRGKIEELKNLIYELRSKGKIITCLFISKGTLTLLQKQTIEYEFKLPVMDRYSIVIQILRLHAVSAESKLQVAMAEIPYIWQQMKDQDVSIGGIKQRVYLTDTQKQMLRNREKRLKTELEKIRSHRELLRNRRRNKNYPIIAVVGYTNSGKTSLIKALTDEKALQPKDQLFATLDVTAHSGLLPCNLEVLYMDTVGFMSDIPTGLIECFVATLEDAMLADVIIHVQDVSHENYKEQKLHVEKTLASLMKNLENSDDDSLKNIINVGNKADLIDENSEAFADGLNMISSKTHLGVDELLKEVEQKVLTTTKRQKVIIKVPMGGPEVAWLYKNSAVTHTEADPNNSQVLMAHVVISEIELQKFRNNFLKR